MCLVDKVLQIKQDAYTYGLSLALNYIQLEFVYKVETDSCVNDYYASITRKMNDLCGKILNNIEDYTSILALKEAYSEALMFSKLSSYLNITPFPTANSKTPDFVSKFFNKEYFFEIKSLGMPGGHSNYKKICIMGLNPKLSWMTRFQVVKI